MFRSAHMPGDGPPPHQIQIEPNGVWHRRRVGNGRNATACGVHFDMDLIVADRPFTLDRSICPDCHTAHELELGLRDGLAKLEHARRTAAVDKARAAVREAFAQNWPRRPKTEPPSDE